MGIGVLVPAVGELRMSGHVHEFVASCPYNTRSSLLHLLSRAARTTDQWQWIKQTRDVMAGQYLDRNHGRPAHERISQSTLRYLLTRN